MRIGFVLSIGAVAGAIILAAQPAAAPAPQAAKPAAAPVATLKLLVLQGKDAVNDILGRTLTTPVVEVRDDNDQPVEGAQVVFELPSTGPGGFFPGNTITFTTRANVQGQASAPFTPNGEAGRFVIRVTATSGNRFGQISIAQTNSTVAPGPDKIPRRFIGKKWLILGGAAVAAAVTIGVVLATRGGSTAATTTAAKPTILVGIGPPVFGGPR